MLPRLHDPVVYSEIRGRIAALRPDAQRQWGTMTIDQMLRHVNRALDAALGHSPVKPWRFRMPRAMGRLLVIRVPWPKGAPTPAEFVVGDRHDFDVEKARLLQLLDEFVARPMDGEWPTHFSFPAQGRDFSELQAKHLHHHLKQFSA